MFSFDLSVIDVVLAISVVVLGLLFLSQRKSNPAPAHESEAPLEDSEEKAPSTQASNDSGKCSHYFGYLRSRPKNIPIPDECFGCSKQLRCLFKNESDESARKHVTAEARN